MKSIVQNVLTTATIASAAVLPPLDLLSNPTALSQPSLATLSPSGFQPPTTNLSLPFSSRPDKGFKVSISIRDAFLPVDSALLNILYFMSIVASQDPNQELQPRSYSTPYYRDVRITSFNWTEARFLLWGVYYGVSYIVKNARFHDLRLDLYWEDKLVGKMNIAARRVAGLVGGAARAPLNVTGSEEDEPAGPGSEVGNATIKDLAFNASTTLPVAEGFRIVFDRVAGATRVDRNDLFLAFCTAFLHVAQYPAGSQMRAFEVKSPNGKLSLHLHELGIGCQVS